jgi:undecaprenyl-diphosphatase
MSLLNIVVLAIVQGLAELLPVSSSAHVIVTEKLLGLDPSSPQMTLVLVMLHTGTMFAVVVYFWRQWRSSYFHDVTAFKKFAGLVVLATALTAVVGEAVTKIIERYAFGGMPSAEIEDLFGHLEIIAPALAAAGVIILIAGIYERRPATRSASAPVELGIGQASAIGAAQGLCLPLRGFSRSGATISTAMLLGVAKSRAENFSFALAVVLTPPVVVREILRLIHSDRLGGTHDLASVGMLSVLGAAVAFCAGLLALKWLSQWLEHGRWYFFGIYCLAAAAAVAALHHAGY